MNNQRRFTNLMLLAFCMMALAPLYASDFRYTDDKESGVLTLHDGGTPVFAYNYRDQLPDGIDPKYARSTFVHPLYSLDGEVLTDAFPADHPHHRGLSWMWPRGEVRGVQTQTWHPHEPPLKQHFVRWEKQTADGGTAVLKAHNKWLLDEKEKVARETVTLRVHPVQNDKRLIEAEIELEAIGGPLMISGAPQGSKGYGGFFLRAAPRFTGATITTESGTHEGDIVNEPHGWTDISDGKDGIAIFASPNHPGFPVHWMVRNSYAGMINVSWPGLEEYTLQPGEPVTLAYQIIIHRGSAQDADVANASAFTRKLTSAEHQRLGEHSGAWQPLFNGENLDNWIKRGGEATYRLEDGAIVGITAPNTPNTFLCTKKDYSDFELTFEVKVDPRLNSGVQFRSLSKPDYRNGRVHGYQFEIDPSERAYSGGIYDEARRGWLADLSENPKARQAFKQNEWNKMRLLAVGDEMQTWVNGVPAVTVNDNMTSSGFIGLQVHSTKSEQPLEVRWRNIMIREID